MNEPRFARPPRVLEYHGPRPAEALPAVPLNERILLAEHGVLVTDARVTAGRTTVAVAEIAAVEVKLGSTAAVDALGVLTAISLAVAGLAIWAASGVAAGAIPAVFCWSGAVLILYFLFQPRRQINRCVPWIECRSGRRHSLGAMDRAAAGCVADAIVRAMVGAAKSGRRT